MTTDLSPKVSEAIQRIATAPDCRLAWEFFIFFSRFEYALKRDTRYLMAGTGNAQPNWERFACDNACNFLRGISPELQTAVEFYLRHPPKKQLRDGGEMKWSDPQAWDRREPQLVWLLGVVRTVRNNLFHGGKFPLLLVTEPSRDSDLITNGLAILKGSLALDANIQGKFLEGLE